jgi:hypothetical protein
MEIMAVLPDTTIQGFYSKAKTGDRSSGAAQENIVRGQENARASLLRARQVQRVKSAEPFFFDLSRALGSIRVRNNHFVSEDEQSLSVPSAFRIWVAAHLDAQNGAAHPRSSANTNHPHDVFHRLSLSADADWL